MRQRPGYDSSLYDPNRVNYPVRRTNPEKGIFVDPKWKRISWDEALDEMAVRLRKIRAENPNKLMHGGTPSPGMGPNLPLGFAFSRVFGTKNWHNAALDCIVAVALIWVPDFIMPRGLSFRITNIVIMLFSSF